MTTEKKAQYQRTYFARKKREGLCYCCRQPAAHGIRCDFHFEEMKRRRRIKQAERRCSCGKPVLLRRRLCEECSSAKKTEIRKLRQEREKPTRRERYHDEKSKGICVRCHKRKARPAGTYCQKCRVAWNAKRRGHA